MRRKINDLNMENFRCDECDALINTERDRDRAKTTVQGNETTIVLVCPQCKYKYICTYTLHRRHATEPAPAAASVPAADAPSSNGLRM